MLAVNDTNKNLLGTPFPVSPPGHPPFILQDCSKLFFSASSTSGLSCPPCRATIVHISMLLPLLFMSVFQGRTRHSYSINPDWMNTYPLHITLDLTWISQRLIVKWDFWSSKLLEKLLLYGCQTHTEKPSRSTPRPTLFPRLCPVGRDLRAQP